MLNYTASPFIKAFLAHQPHLSQWQESFSSPTRKINVLLPLTGPYFATGSVDGHVCIWDSQTGGCYKRFFFAETEICALALLNPDCLLIGGNKSSVIHALSQDSQQNTLYAWSWHSNSHEACVPHKSMRERIMAIQVTEDKQIIVIYTNGMIYVHNENWQFIEKIFPFYNPIVAISLRLGRELLVGVTSGRVLRYSLPAANRFVKEYEKPYDDVTALATLADGRIVVGYANSEIHILDADTGARLVCFSGHPQYSYPTSIANLPGDNLISASPAGTLAIWNSTTGQVLQILTGHHQVCGVIVLETGNVVMMCTNFGQTVIKIMSFPPVSR